MKMESYTDTFSDEKSEEDLEEQPEDGNLTEKIQTANQILKKLKFYAKFHGLNMLNSKYCLERFIELV